MVVLREELDDAAEADVRLKAPPSEGLRAWAVSLRAAARAVSAFFGAVEEAEAEASGVVNGSILLRRDHFFGLVTAAGSGVLTATTVDSRLELLMFASG